MPRLTFWLLLLGVAAGKPLGPWQLVVSRHTEARGPSRYLEIRLNSQGAYSLQSTTTASAMRRKPIIQKRQGKLTPQGLQSVERALGHPDLWDNQPKSPASQGPTQTTLHLQLRGTLREYSSARGTLSPPAQRLVEAVERALPPSD